MFSLTSSRIGIGISELFNELARAFYKKIEGKLNLKDPNMKEKVKSNKKYNNDTIKLNIKPIRKKNTKCCGKDNK